MAKLAKKVIKNFKGKVYDLTVEDTHSYNIDGISVHNSAAGCLLSWCLDIIKIDPLRFGLYFERFLNPTRNSAPDCDTDFMTGTDHVIDSFLYKKYGRNRVLNVGTFLTFSERGCLKDVVRAIKGKEASGQDSVVNKVTNEMPNFDKVPFSLGDWFRDWPKNDKCSHEVREFLQDPNNQKVLEITLKLQGNVRGIGQHAAGIVITPSECWNYIPTNVIAKEKGEGYAIVTAFQEADKSGKDLSALGILKLDRLKLQTLNIIKDTATLIKEQKGVDILDSINYIDLKDKNLFDEVKLGMNHGIFQFESPGMNALVKGVSTDKFDELVACNALYRPGPMGIGAHKEYIKNKFNPEQSSYVHESLEPILSETNGVMIYQEQLMFIANQIGGMSLGDGDNLRRAMDKAGKLIEKEVNGQELTEEEKNSKDYKLFVQYWNQFLDGAEKNGIKKEELRNLKEYLIKYLGYSFNKCLSENHVVESKERGTIKLLDVKVGEEILTYDTKNRVEIYHKVKAIHKNGIKRVYRITTESNKILECTIDHKILAKKGMFTLDFILNKHLKIKARAKAFEKIVGIEKVGDIETYDLEIDSDDHNFFANGICVSNSHSVSYSYISMQTLFLKHYYPTEFYTSLLNNAKGSGNPEEIKQWITAVITCAMSKGITIKQPSRKSGWDWKMTGDKEISMGFSAIKGFGDVAYQELLDVLKNKNKKFDDLSKFAFLDLPLSKFGKATFEAGLKAGIFDDWSPSREEMLDLFEKSKKSNKKKSATQYSIFGATYEPELKHNEIKFPATNENLKKWDFIEVCNFDLSYINRIARIKDDVSKKAQREISSINDYYEKDYYWFILDGKTNHKTKTGKKYLRLKAADGISHTNLNVFGSDVDEIEPKLEIGGIYVGYFEKNDAGFMNFSKRVLKEDRDKEHAKKRVYLVKVDNL